MRTHVKRCAMCGSTALSQGNGEFSRAVAGHRFVGRLRAATCGDCGEHHFAGTDVDAFDVSVALELARAGVTAGEAVAFMRKAVGMRGIDLAELLGVRPETVSRWETGRRTIDRATLAILSLLLDDRRSDGDATVRALRAMSGARPLGKRVRIELP